MFGNGQVQYQNLIHMMLRMEEKLNKMSRMTQNGLKEFCVVEHGAMDTWWVRSSVRYRIVGPYINNNIGFRCAASE